MDEANKNPTIRQYPLEPTKVMKRFLASETGYAIWLVILSVLAIVASFAIGMTFPTWNAISFSIIAIIILVLLFIAISIINWWYQAEYYRKYYYDIRENFLVIKKGVFMPSETILPFEKLQDVYMDQDLFDRMFNLWDLHVSTATIMSGAQAHIDGVNIKNGEAMREILLKKIKSRA